MHPVARLPRPPIQINVAPPSAPKLSPEPVLYVSVEPPKSARLLQAEQKVRKIVFESVEPLVANEKVDKEEYATFNEDELANREIIVKDRLITLKATNLPFSTAKHKVMFVVYNDGKVYSGLIGDPKKYHLCFQRAILPISVGQWKVRKGHITYIDERSKHFQPQDRYLTFISILNYLKCDVQITKIEIVKQRNLDDEDELDQKSRHAKYEKKPRGRVIVAIRGVAQDFSSPVASNNDTPTPSPTPTPTNSFKQTPANSQPTSPKVAPPRTLAGTIAKVGASAKTSAANEPSCGDCLDNCVIA